MRAPFVKLPDWSLDRPPRARAVFERDRCRGAGTCATQCDGGWKCPETDCGWSKTNADSRVAWRAPSAVSGSEIAALKTTIAPAARSSSLGRDRTEFRISCERNRSMPTRRELLMGGAATAAFGIASPLLATVREAPSAARRLYERAISIDGLGYLSSFDPANGPDAPLIPRT